MPHKCTNCGNVFEDGSDDVLSGCDCGSRKFEYVFSENEADQSTPQNEEEPTVAEYNQQEQTEESSDPTDSLEDSIIIADESTDESESQRRARSEIVSDEDLPSTGTSPTSLGKNQDIEDVKQQLHEQFEGIRILEPGNYQINLMKLYKKQECVISLQEDGRYIINVPGMMESEVDDPEDDESDN